MLNEDAVLNENKKYNCTHAATQCDSSRTPSTIAPNLEPEYPEDEKPPLRKVLVLPNSAIKIKPLVLGTFGIRYYI